VQGWGKGPQEYPEGCGACMDGDSGEKRGGKPRSVARGIFMVAEAYDFSFRDGTL